METMYLMCRDSAEVGSDIAPVRQSARRISSCISILPKKDGNIIKHIDYQYSVYRVERSKLYETYTCSYTSYSLTTFL
jgi:hypothetical protein